MTLTTIVRPPDDALRSALRLAAAFAALKLALQFALTLWTQHLGYGYFRDEFYYIACGRHLAWGYVDHGPIVAVQARLGEILFGDSLFAIRILSACAGAATMFLTGLVAWALGGRRPAQGLAMIGILCCPQYIGTHGFLSMNSFEPLFWTLCLFALFLLQHGYSLAGCWTLFGVSAGLGLLNKPSMVFFLVALGLGLLCTRQRSWLFTRWAAWGVALLTVIALPNLIWQIHNHWPTLEFLRNGRAEHKNAVLTPAKFLLTQVANMQPVNALLWVTGVVALMRSKSVRNARWLGVTYLFFFVIMLGMHAKDYYLAGIYPAFFAAGAIAWEARFSQDRAVLHSRIFAFPVLETVLVISSILILPMASPVLRPATWLRYTTAMHLRSQNAETESTGPLPQFYADRFGWMEEVVEVGRIYNSLSPSDQRRAGISCSNYGEAGSINFLAPRMGLSLPDAISGHNNYYLWGPGNATGEVMIVISGGTLSDIQELYDDVTVAGHMGDAFSMPFEHRNIYLARGRKKPIDASTWPEFKKYI